MVPCDADRLLEMWRDSVWPRLRADAESRYHDDRVCAVAEHAFASVIDHAIRDEHLVGHEPRHTRGYRGRAGALPVRVVVRVVSERQPRDYFRVEVSCPILDGGRAASWIIMQPRHAVPPSWHYGDDPATDVRRELDALRRRADVLDPPFPLRPLEEERVSTLRFVEKRDVRFAEALELAYHWTREAVDQVVCLGLDHPRVRLDTGLVGGRLELKIDCYPMHAVLISDGRVERMQCPVWRDRVLLHDAWTRVRVMDKLAYTPEGFEKATLALTRELGHPAAVSPHPYGGVNRGLVVLRAGDLETVPDL